MPVFVSVHVNAGVCERACTQTPLIIPPIPLLSFQFSSEFAQAA